MKFKKLGQVIAWLGTIILIGGGWILTWVGTPIMRKYSLEELKGTIWEPHVGSVHFFWENSFIFGAGLAVIGLLMYTHKKGSKTWILGLIAFIFSLALYFILDGLKVGYSPPLYGLGGGLITFSFVGILWFWIKTRAPLEGHRKVASDLKLVGYFFLLVAMWFVCGLTGGPHLKAYGYAETIPHLGEMTLITLTLGWVFLFISYWFDARKK